MCGRYANFMTEQELVDAFEIAVVADEPRLFDPSWNVSPTQNAPIVAPVKDDPGQRRLEPARWGLVPAWAKDPSIGARMINARAETVADKPSFRSAFAKRRCIVPANGYFEWRTADGVKTPHYIHRADDAPLAMAGLYEFWKDKAAADDAEWLVTFSVVTTAARGDMRDIHDRQPVMLDDDQWPAWLHQASTPDDLFAAIEAPAPDLTWHPVRKAVGNPRNNEPANIEPAD